MIHTIKVNIEEVIDLYDDDTKIDFIKHIIFDLSDEKRTEFIKYLLDDLMQAEVEFNGRENIINAYKTLIDNKL